MDLDTRESYIIKSKNETQRVIDENRDNIDYPERLFCNYPFVIHMEQNSKLVLNGKLYINSNCEDNYYRSTIIRLKNNSRMIINKDFKIFYGGDIQLFENAILEVGNSFINSDCKIRCKKYIHIGDGCAISHDVTIMDSDFHHIEGQLTNTSPITICDNVWIGTRSTILKGVTLGEGSIVAAGSVVTKDVLPHTMVGGNPAEIIKVNVNWKK